MEKNKTEKKEKNALQTLRLSDRAGNELKITLGHADGSVCVQLDNPLFFIDKEHTKALIGFLSMKFEEKKVIDF